MDRCVCVAYRYHDVDVAELNVSAWNGGFGGSTGLWVAQGELGEAADLLAGFPANLEDTRELTFGAFGPEFAGGAMNLKFSSIDLAGHCRLHLRMESNYEHRESLAERVELLGAVEPAAVDRFVEQVRYRSLPLNVCMADKPTAMAFWSHISRGRGTWRCENELSQSQQRDRITERSAR